MEIVKQMTSRALLVAAAAITVAIAAITMLPAAPARAQSEESAGRIVARLLEDDRVEFGWQPTGGARVLPTQRYFPAAPGHNRWLRSSPVEVDGAEIGRINARLLSDGRIEFAFTPTDRERIEPQARYFPADARVGRWLRSTEITIGPAAPRYVAVSASYNGTCAIRESEEIACWGADWGTGLPDGSYTAVSVGWNHACAIRTNGELVCWGSNGYPTWDPETETTIFIQTGVIDAPEGSYTAISAGGHHTCALRESGEIACWGDNEHGQTDAPPVRFTAISAGSLHTCAIRTNGEIACWGINDYGETDAPEGSYSDISAAFHKHTCALRESGEIACWGENRQGQSDAPEGSYSAVSAGGGHTCALRESGEIACWGWNEDGQTDAPEGSYSAISAGGRHTCALRESGEIACWGANGNGQTDVPTN